MATYTLIGDVDAADTVICIAPAYVKAHEWPCVVEIEGELMAITGGDGTTSISVERGYAGTTAADIASGQTMSDVTATYA